MTDERDLSELMTEMRRVGVDPHSFPAGIGVSREDALRALGTLENDAGPSAFLAAIRGKQQRGQTDAG